MKELGGCPRCGCEKINSLELYYQREEICDKCGFCDTYKLRGAQNVKTNFIAGIMITIICAVAALSYLFFL